MRGDGDSLDTSASIGAAGAPSGRDWTEDNNETIASLRLHSMSVEEMVAADRREGARLHFSDGVWWREVKPFYYQPANPAMVLGAGEARPKWWLSFGGYYHLVPSSIGANGSVVYNEISDLATYDLAGVRKTKRHMIRRGLRALRVMRITEPDVLLGEGYRVYLDWEQRTAGVRVKRSAGAVYERWVRRLLQHPHQLVLGAFHGERLAAWVVARAIEGRADLSKAFSHSEFRHVEPTSALIHAYLLICQRSPQIRVACDGLRSLKPSLEEYKAGFGFEHRAYPAHIHMAPLIRPVVKRTLPDHYRRLIGDYAG